MQSTMRKKRATTQTPLDHFFKRVDRIESSKEPVQSVSVMSEIAACPPSPVADNPSALPSPTSSSSSRPAFFRRCTCQCDKGQPLYHYRGTTERKRASPPGLARWLGWERICLQCRRPEFYPVVGKIPWRRKWQATPVFLPGESHGQKSLVGYSPWGCKEWD